MPDSHRDDTSKPPSIGGIPRYRATRLPPLLSQGFRPFFLAALVWAPVSLGLWIGELAGLLVLPSRFGGALWHAHELIFGFAQAAMAGFLMTAIPNWTGRMPLQGVPLLLLAAVWLLGRVAVAVSNWTGTLAAATLDLAFPALLILAFGREIAAGRNWRNLPMLAALGLMLAANAATHLAVADLLTSAEWGLRAGISILAALIALVGGRLIPSFTRNRLAKERATPLLASFGLRDRVMLSLVPASLLAWTFALPAVPSGALLVAAGCVTLARLAGWRGWRILGDSLVLALHLGYAWLGIGLLLLGIGQMTETVPPMAGLHALAVGAIGTSILAVIGRTALSHTGHRSVRAQAAFAPLALISLAAVARIASAFADAAAWPLLWIAAIAWVLAFLLLLSLIGPALLLPTRRG